MDYIPIKEVNIKNIELMKCEEIYIKEEPIEEFNVPQTSTDAIPLISNTQGGQNCNSESDDKKYLKSENIQLIGDNKDEIYIKEESLEDSSSSEKTSYESMEEPASKEQSHQFCKSKFNGKEKMELNEIHDALMEENEDQRVLVAIEPPIEDATAETDCDSDLSDNEVSCDPDHLPRRILLTNVISQHEDKQLNESGNQHSTSSTLSTQKRRKVNIDWHKNKGKSNGKVNDYEECDSNNEEDIQNILESIGHYWTDDWLDYICHQSILYAQQKSFQHDCLTRDNLRVFFGILILSGYNRLPNRRLYWAQMEDVQNSLVVNSMRRDTFDQIMKCLHFADNMLIDEDRFYKVRPIFEHMNKTIKVKKECEFINVDDIMVPYYGRHGDKQFIRGKPVRFGFKLWAGCTSDGTLLHVEPYCGSHTKVPDHDLGHGPNVVMEMVNKIELRKGQHVICDNYFGSIALLKELSEKGIAVTSTLREDRLGGAPLLIRKLMEKKKRGYMEEAFTESVSVVKWKDNKVVSVGSNKLRADPIQTAKRWDRIARKHVQIDMPNSVYVYNKHMGGVDLFDQQISVYRIRVRSKKWWWPLFAWSLNAQVVNAWMRYRKNERVSLLDFSRNVVISLLKTYGAGRKQPGPKLHLSNSLQDTVRFNEKQHWTAKGQQQRCRCRECGRRTLYICKMCELPVHPECMEDFHSKN